MADDEQFSLCWNNFNSNLSAGFHESLCRGDLVDVTLAAEGQFVKAHRLVLSVCSPYFRKMFTQMPANQHAFVFLKDVSHSALKDLIQFMYCGEVNVKQDALPAFISTAEALQIKGLTDGEPAPSQSPAKPSTPAPQQSVPGPSMTAASPRIKQRSSTTRSYKIESEDSGDDKSPQVAVVHQQTSTQTTQNLVQQTQKRPAQRSITPHTVSTVKRAKNNDPLEATDPTQITVQTVSDKTSTDEPEFIDLPIDLPTKSEPDYSEEAGEVETTEQEATYVEDDSYGDMKYDESYFTENDETGAAATTSATVKATSGTFSESYVSDAGEQTTEAQALEQLRSISKMKEIKSTLSSIEKPISYIKIIPDKSNLNAEIGNVAKPKQPIRSLLKKHISLTETKNDGAQKSQIKISKDFLLEKCSNVEKNQNVIKQNPKPINLKKFLENPTKNISNDEKIFLEKGCVEIKNGIEEQLKARIPEKLKIFKENTESEKIDHVKMKNFNEKIYAELKVASSQTKTSEKLKRGRPRTKIPEKSFIEKSLDAIRKNHGEPVVFASSTIGGMKIVYKGHHFKFYHKRDRFSLYKCCWHDRKNCEVKILASENYVYPFEENEHNHNEPAIDNTVTAHILKM